MQTRNPRRTAAAYVGCGVQDWGYRGEAPVEFVRDILTAAQRNYARATPETRQRYNAAFFTRLIAEDKTIKRVAWAELFATLFFLWRRF